MEPDSQNAPPLLDDTSGTYDLTHVIAITPVISHFNPKNPDTKKTVAVLHYIGGQSLRTNSDYINIKKLVFGAV